MEAFSFMKIMGMICLLLVAWFVVRAYRQFREVRLHELEALVHVLSVVREDIGVYHTFRPIALTEELAPLSRLGFLGCEDVGEELRSVLPRMNLSPREKKRLFESLGKLGEGNLQSETQKVENIIENVKNMLQKEEEEGRKSVDTLRIVLFTVILSLVIILL